MRVGIFCQFTILPRERAICRTTGTNLLIEVKENIAQFAITIFAIVTPLVIALLAENYFKVASMGDVSPPLNQKYPNWGKGLDECLPVICTLLFSFSGTFFITAAAADEKTLGISAQTHLWFFVWSAFSVKPVIMLVSGICSLLFVTSVMSSVYSRLYDVDRALEALNKCSRSPDQMAMDEQVAKCCRKRQDRLRSLSAFSFNVGMLLLPVCGLVFLEKPKMLALGFVYCAALLIFLARQWLSER